MSTIEEQLARRRLDEQRKFIIHSLDFLKKQRENADKEHLSEMFLRLKTYKRIDESILVIQRFMRSFRYKFMMKILKKKHQEPDPTIHSINDFNRFYTLEADRLTAISQSRDLKNDPLTRIHVILIGFVRTHSQCVDEANFIEYLREKFSPDEYQYLTQYIGNMTFIQFFESTIRTKDEISSQKRMRYYVSKLVWILYYILSEKITKCWFQHRYLDIEIVFNLLQIQIQEFIQEEKEAIEKSVQYEQSPHYQPEYNQCSGCGIIISSPDEVYINGMCFHPACVRPRDNTCASCGHPIGGNAVKVDGMSLHPDCASHNQSNSYFRDHPECSACRRSSNDMTMFEGIGLICDACVHASANP